MAKAKPKDTLSVRLTLATPRAHLFTSVGKKCHGDVVELPADEANAAISAGLAQPAEMHPAPATSTAEPDDAAGEE